ncbi:hypothetical protein BGW41_004251 [Actinomortierella wolfii]|nr:hypothetical protein BGW41_004251 [Actinomortierella wolfii]
MDNHSRYPFPLQQSFLLHQNPIVQKPQSAKLAGALNATKRIQRRQQQQLQHYQQQQQHFQHSVDKESAIPQNGSFLQRFPGSKTAHTDAESGHHPQLALQIPLNYSQVSLGAGRNDSVISPLTGTSTLTSYSEDDRNNGFYGSTSPLKRAFSMGSLPSFKSALRGGSRHFPYQKISAVETAVTAVYPTAPTMDNQEQTEQFIESLEYAIERAQQLRDQLRKEHQCYPSSLTPIPMPNKDMASPSTANTLIPGPLSDGTAHAGAMHTSVGRNSTRAPTIYAFFCLDTPATIPVSWTRSLHEDATTGRPAKLAANSMGCHHLYHPQHHSYRARPLWLVVPIYALVDNCSARYRATQTNIALDEQVACVYHI